MPASTLKELLKQKEILDAQIEQVRTEERAKAISAVLQYVTEYGLTVDDIFPRTHTPPKKPAAKLPARYRNKELGVEWSGKGKRPQWVVNALAEGRKLEDFAI